MCQAESCDADALYDRQPSAHQHAQSAPGGSRSAAASSQAPYIDLEDTYNQCMASFSEAGTALQATLCPDGLQRGATADALQSWGDPDSQK